MYQGNTVIQCKQPPGSVFARLPQAQGTGTAIAQPYGHCCMTLVRLPPMVIRILRSLQGRSVAAATHLIFRSHAHLGERHYQHRPPSPSSPLPPRDPPCRFPVHPAVSSIQGRQHAAVRKSPPLPRLGGDGMHGSGRHHCGGETDASLRKRVYAASRAGQLPSVFSAGVLQRRDRDMRKIYLRWLWCKVSGHKGGGRRGNVAGVRRENQKRPGELARGWFHGGSVSQKVSPQYGYDRNRVLVWMGSNGI